MARSNTRVKDAAKLSRRSARAERRLFLADGPKAVEGALSVPGCVVEVFATSAATERYADLPGLAPAWTLAEPRALEALSDSVTPAGLVAVCRFLDVPVTNALAGSPQLVVVCADVRDPGNAGTVIRTADAMGSDTVLLAGSSVDAYNPKTVRASVGSLFRLPVSVVPDAADALAAARTAGLTVLAADGAGEVDLDEADDLLTVQWRGCSATRPGASPPTWPPPPTTGSGSRSTAAPRASTCRPPPRCASTPRPGSNAADPDTA